jgi:glycosyltransferase involved in cell wall biosynthesis
MPPVYLVIPSTGVGGMEKRLVEVWLRLAPLHDNLRLVLSQGTLAALREQPEISDLSRFADRLTVFAPASHRYPAMMGALARVVWGLPRGSTVHYLLNAPPLIDRLRGHRMIVSWVANFTPRPHGGRAAMQTWLTAQLAFRSAHRLDILNPDVAEALSRQPGLAVKIATTAGGSFTDFDHFRPAAAKQDDVVFLGRTEAVKNPLAFVQAIPLIAGRLARSGRAARFLLYGAAAGQEPAIQALLASPEYRGLAIERGHTGNPAALLSQAKVFVSLQVPSNYPSKALVEAMGCGCVPVINASGESRLMADDGLASYIPAAFTPDELANAVAGVLLLDEPAFAKRSAAVRAQAIERFRIERQVEYFARLWGLEG